MASDTQMDFFPSQYHESGIPADQSYGRSQLTSSMDPLGNASFEDEPPLLDGISSLSF